MDQACNKQGFAQRDWYWKGEYWTLGEGGRGSGITFSLRPNGRSCGGVGAAIVAEGGMAASSRHPGGVNVAMADGSVQFISSSVNHRVWWGMGSIAGGETSK